MLSSSASSEKRVAPLNGITVIEFAGLAPAPFAGLILADWGASVIRIDRADQESSTDFLCRGKRSLAVNLKSDSGRGLLKRIISKADVVIDPYRPGVLDKLGLGPDQFLGNGGLNNTLVFARMAGFPRDGPHKDMAGHDINYLALSGVLSMLSGPQSKPTFPLNLLADFAGGGLMCALGILLALLQRGATGKGQVVDVDMVSGTRYLASFPLIHALAPASPFFGKGEYRGTMALDGGAPFYAVYESKDGEWMSVGCLEPQFFKIFMSVFVGSLPDEFLDKHRGWKPTEESRTDISEWPRMRRFLEDGFRTKTRDEWAKIFHGLDACVVPILSPDEAAQLAGSEVPIPHPKLNPPPDLGGMDGDLSSHNSRLRTLVPGEHTREILSEFGLSTTEVENLRLTGVLRVITPVKPRL